MTEPINFIPVSKANRANFCAPKGPTLGKSTRYAYTRTYLKYNQPVLDDKGQLLRTVAEECNFEMGPVECTIINSKMKDGSGDNYSMAVNLVNEDDIKGLWEIYYGGMNCVYQNRQKLGRPSMQPLTDGMLDDGIKPLVSYEKDKEGNIVAGAKPTLWLKLEGNMPEPKFITFKPKLDEAGNVIPDEYDEVHNTWQSLIGSKMTASIIFQVRDFFKGNVQSFQVFLRSCVIFERSGSGELKHEKSEVVRQMLKEQIMKNPEAMRIFAEEMARLQTTATPIPSKTPSLLKTEPAGPSGTNAPASGQVPLQGTVIYGGPQQTQQQPQMPSYQPFTQAPPQQQYTQQPPPQMPNFGAQQYTPQQGQFQQMQVPSTPGIIYPNQQPQMTPYGQYDGMANLNQPSF